MSEHPIIAFIGSGVMGEAMLAGLLKHGVTVPENIRASDPRVDRGIELQSIYKVHAYTNNHEAVQNADVVVLSVKPQLINKVLAELQNQIPQKALVFSIVAGASIQQISSGLNHPNVVRSMPNTPAQIGEGITVWTASAEVSQIQKELARQMLHALGQEVYVETEEEYFLDMATALSGSGPAYVFLFMEAMIDAGVHLGFPRRISEQLVVQTLKGSVAYYQAQKAHPAHLRNAVTSPGGTSAAALYYLEKAGIRTAISRAIWAAYERSIELGKGKKSRSPEENDKNTG